MKQRDAMLGTESIGKLLVKLSVPAMIGMIVNALYNLVDAIFIGRGVGPLAIGALAISFPVLLLIAAVAMMLGVGAASVVSRNLGSGNRERAYTAAGNTLIISIIFGTIILVLGQIFIEPILKVLGATDSLMEYAREYLSVLLFGSVFITFAMASNNLVRAEGRATVAMISMVIGTGMNIILDPIFIFVLGMGIRGAATATVISMFLSFLFLLLFFLGKKSSLELRLIHLKPNFSVLGEIVKLGLPIFARQFGASFLVVIINNSLKLYGSDIYISAFGMVHRLLTFTIMPLFGLAQGFQPIVGYNFGANQIPRVKHTLKLALLVSTLLATASFLVMMIFPRILLSIFTTDSELLDIGVSAIRLVILVLPLLGLQIIGSTYFQAVGKALPSLVLGMSRQIILLLPLTLLLPLIFGVTGVWAAFPVADFLATVLTVIWLISELRKLKPVHPGERIS